MITQRIFGVNASVLLRLPEEPLRLRHTSLLGVNRFRASGVWGLGAHLVWKALCLGLGIPCPNLRPRSSDPLIPMILGSYAILPTLHC